MGTIKLLGAIIIFGLFAVSSMSEGYLSTDIAKGYSWRYQRIEHANDGLLSSNRIIDFTIDSIWGNPSDTLFFGISERDSVNYNYSTTDTVFTQINHILCRKANRITHCDSLILSEMFSDNVNTKYDSLVDNESAYLRYSLFSHPIIIGFYQEQYAGLQVGTYFSGEGTHMGSTVDTSIFCDHIGLLQEKYVHNGWSLYESRSISFTLLSHNGKDVSYTCVKPVYTRKGINSMVPKIYRISLDRGNLNPGFNLLGRQNELPVSAYGMRISRLPLQK